MWTSCWRCALLWLTVCHSGACPVAGLHHLLWSAAYSICGHVHFFSFNLYYCICIIRLVVSIVLCRPNHVAQDPASRRNVGGVRLGQISSSQLLRAWLSLRSNWLAACMFLRLRVCYSLHVLGRAGSIPSFLRCLTILELCSILDARYSTLDTRIENLVCIS